MINDERNILLGCPDPPRKRRRSGLLRFVLVTVLVLSSLGIFTPSTGQAYVRIVIGGRPYYGYPYVYRGRYYYGGRYYHHRYYRYGHWRYY